MERSSGRSRSEQLSSIYACCTYKCVRVWEGPSGDYGYERGCRGRVLFLNMLDLYDLYILDFLIEFEDEGEH